MSCRLVFAAVVVAGSGLVEGALLNAPRFVQPYVPQAPAGFTVNDLYLDFSGELGGQQLFIELDSGSIFHSEVNAITPQPAAFSGLFPDLAADSFVTVGGFTTEDSA